MSNYGFYQFQSWEGQRDSCRYEGKSDGEYLDICPDGLCDNDLIRDQWFSGDDRKHIAKKIDQLREKIVAQQKIYCQLLCELSWWTAVRQVGDDNELNPENSSSGCFDAGGMCATTFVDHNPCRGSQYTYGLSNDPTWTWAPPFEEAQFKELDGHCYVNQPRPLPKMNTEAGKELLERVLICDAVDWINYMKDYLVVLETECDYVELDIEYEKSQRKNLTVLRETKGITDWHLSIIYPEREDIIEMVAPESEFIRDIKEEEETQKKLFKTIAIVLGGGLLSFGLYKGYKRIAS